MATPTHFNINDKSTAENRVELKYLLISTLLGYPFGFKTQQANKLVHDVVAVKGHETEQLGSSSSVELAIHTEDSFHEFRGEFISLLCLRNDEEAVTVTSRPDLSELSEEERTLLYRPGYLLRPDDSYKAEYGTTDADAADYDSFEGRYGEGTLTPILYGQSDDPFIIFDPHYTQVVDPECEAVFEHFGNMVREAEHDHILRAGEIIVIDNQRTLHGRRPYEPRFDQDSRWMKRINTSVDLRKSAHLRQAMDCPFIVT